MKIICTSSIYIFFILYIKIRQEVTSSVLNSEIFIIQNLYQNDVVLCAVKIIHSQIHVDTNEGYITG